MKYIRLYESFRMINEQQGQIYKRPKDPYEYKVEDDNWLSRRKGTDKWFNITGGDFKPAYQKSIDLLDKEFPKARTEESPKRGGEETPKEAAPKEVEYTRDNGEAAKGTIVDVDKEKETVTIKAPSGKEFEKPFDKVEMANDELKKLSETPPPAETKKEEKPAEDNQQRVLKSSQDNPPKGLKQFFLADDKAIEYMKDEGADISTNGKTYVFPFPPNDKDEFVYLSGYNTDEEKIGRIYVGSIGPSTDISTFDGKEQLEDAVNTANDMKKQMGGSKDEEARKKSKAADEAEDKMTTSKSGSKVSNEKPNYTFKIRFVGSDWTVSIFNNGKLIDTQIFSGINFKEDSIKKQLQEIGRSSGFLEYDPADEPGRNRPSRGGGVPQPDLVIK